MKPIKNFKHFRKEPSIWGMTVKGFIIFIIITVCSLMTLTTGVSIAKLIVLLVVVGVAYLLAVTVFSKNQMFTNISNENLPKKKSKYE